MIRSINATPWITDAISINNNFREQIRKEYQDKLNNDWLFAVDRWDDVLIQKEIGSKEYVPISARITQAFKAKIQDNKRGDEWLKFEFLDMDFNPPYGLYLQWHGNYWIVFNKNNFSKPSSSVICRKCNNVLRKIDYWGVVHEYPMVIGTPKEVSDYTTVQQTQPSGFIPFFLQMDDYTSTIQENDRILVGNPGHWTCFKFSAGGIDNWEQEVTDKMYTAGLLHLVGQTYYENKDTDNLEIGICDFYSNQWNLKSESTYIEQNVGYHTQLNVVKFRNNDISNDGTLKWESSDKAIVAVSNQGEIHCISTGYAIIKCYLSENPDVYTEINIHVTPERLPDTKQIIITPEGIDSVRQGEELTFIVNYYINNVKQDSFDSEIIIDNNSVPKINFSYKILENSFQIKNIKKYYNAPLLITIKVDDNEVIKKIYLVGNL